MLYLIDTDREINKRQHVRHWADNDGKAADEEGDLVVDGTKLATTTVIHLITCRAEILWLGW